MASLESTLPQLIARRASESPGRVAIDSVEGVSVTYSELDAENRRWAAGFQRLGVTRGDAVVTMMPSAIDGYHAWIGLSWLGAVEVPVNVLYRGRMLSYIIDNSGAEVLVVHSSLLPQVAEVAGGLGGVRTVVIPDLADAEAGELPFEAVGRRRFLEGAEAAKLEEPAPWDVACMIYTSGTTGPSKGVLLPWAAIHHFSSTIPGEPLADGAYYSFWPPNHGSGKAALYAPVLHGGRLVMRETFSVGAFWEDVRRFGCTVATLAGPLARMLWLQPEQPEDADNPLEAVLIAPLFPEFEAFAKRFGVRVGTLYGMTEIGAPLWSTDGPPADWRSCGRSRTGPPGYDVRVVDEHDIPVEAGEVGELIVRTSEPWALNCGYYGMPDKTAEAWRNGWFHTGDAFRHDADGNFYFVDRLKDAIRRRGENISSFEVEAYVNDHPDVLECAAIPVPSELGEDDVKVCVVGKTDSALEPESLIEFLAPRMPRHMVPRYIEFVSELPKTDATARTKKVELRSRPLNDRTWDRESGARAVR